MATSAEVDNPAMTKGRSTEKEEEVALTTDDTTGKSEAVYTLREQDSEVKAKAGAEGDMVPVENGLWKLPDEEVQRVLSWKRGRLMSDALPPDGVEAFKALSDMIEEYQDWMRREYEANGGVVLVDDDFMADRAERLKWLAEEMVPVEWDESYLAYWNVSDRLSDFYESNIEEEEEEDMVVQGPETN